MTIEEAIEILKSLWRYKDINYSDTDIRNALDMAIKSLKKSNDVDNIQYEINNLPTYLAKFIDGKFSTLIEKEKVDKIIKRYRIGKYYDS